MQHKATGKALPAYFTFITCKTCKKRTEQLTDGKKDGIRYCLEHGGKP